MHHVKRTVITYYIVTAVMATIIVASCSRQRDDQRKVGKITPNPSYEMNPPIAQSISIQLVEKNATGNIRVVADFGKADMKERLHAVVLGTDTVVLRDDGKESDETAGDNKFSVFILEDIASLTQELEELKKQAKELSPKASFDFVARHKVPLDLTAMDRFDLGAFREGKPVLLPPRFFCFLRFDVSVPHSLLVTAVKTVEDPTRTVHPCACTGTANGAWTFQKLMTDMANTPVTHVSPEDFVKDWLHTWLEDATVNGDAVPQRRLQMFNLVIRPWLIASGNSIPIQFNIDNWRSLPLNLARAPFKLIAIVNRLDLHGNIGYGVSNAGEGRFVFEVLDENCRPIPGRFTVIFEYGIPIRSCISLKAYARQWYDLKNIPTGLGSPQYNAALQKITDVFASANGNPEKPNGSAINQIRTNERAIGAPWELREFNIDNRTHKLALTTVKQEPAEKFNGSSPLQSPAEVAKLVSWINNNASLIQQNKHEVPESLPGTSERFLGGKAHSEPGLWTGTGIADAEVRHHFSFNTCSGCHKLETNTDFVHLSVVPFATESQPSQFLTGGIPVPDPNSPGTTHSFNDLEDRRRKLADLLCKECRIGLLPLVSVLTFEPNKMVH